MIINRSNLRSFQFALDTAFSKGLGMTTTGEGAVHQILCHEKEVIGRKEGEYPWLGASGKIRETTGTKEKVKLPLNRVRVRNGRFSLLIAIDEEDLECDEEGLYKDQAQMFGTEASDHFEDEAAKVLAAGFSTKDYTGSNFFAANKNVAPDLGAKSAKFTNFVTKKFSTANYAAAVASLRTRTDANGKNLGLGNQGFTLIVGPNAEADAKVAIQATQGANGATNVWSGTAKLRVWNWLHSYLPDSWFLVANTVTGTRRPLIKQIGKKISSRMTGTEDVSAIIDGEILYELYGRHRIAYGDPALIYGSDGSTAA
ncbi:MAG: Mu-like prophage major head subunit gpT [Verrucomicrobia bacterium]|nr:MAG: Mu-like prophage major head subunit gpT [Verrucomicrobiota bacterium]